VARLFLGIERHMLRKCSFPFSLLDKKNINKELNLFAMSGLYAETFSGDD
jgi:hypothetical protein